MVNVTMVPGASDIGRALSSAGDGGRCTVPSAPSEPTNPNFQSIARPAAEDEGRAGSGRRGGSTGSIPRHARYFPYAIGAPAATCWASGAELRCSARAGVVRRMIASAPSARTSSAIVCPGRARSNALHNSSAGCAAPVLPTTPPSPSTTRSAATPSFFATAPAARSCVLVTTTWSIWSAPSPASFSAASHASTPRLV